MCCPYSVILRSITSPCSRDSYPPVNYQGGGMDSPAALQHPNTVLVSACSEPTICPFPTYLGCFLNCQFLISAHKVMQPLVTSTPCFLTEPFYVVFSCICEGSLETFLPVMGNPCFATLLILFANSPSAFFDKIFDWQLPLDLCPSPLTIPFKLFLL